MEIALGALIIIILLLPGICFRKGYFSEEFSNQYTIKDFFQLFVNTFIPSIVLYLIALPIILIFGYKYNISTLIGLISSNDTLFVKSVDKVGKFQNEILLFQFIINSISFLIGYQLKNHFIRKSLDSTIEFFRYKNIWHYVLSAKFINFERSQISLNNNTVEDVDITYVDALVAVGEKVFIYNGMLVDYQLATEGHLDFLIIKDVQRKQIDKRRYKDVNGHVIILKYENIINLNLTFIEAEEDGFGGVSFRPIS
ncbi:hypothetical protein ACM55I_11890 [Flavobacterium sp. GB2R13]|uniref:hypothetical protein n=1 Tax=Flavobacterium algoris TaxID=3398733 RepID=UPI003A8C1E34